MNTGKDTTMKEIICKLCQLSSTSNDDLYLIWSLKRLSKLGITHHKKCPNKGKKTLYNLTKRVVNTQSQYN